MTKYLIGYTIWEGGIISAVFNRILIWCSMESTTLIAAILCNAGCPKQKPPSRTNPNYLSPRTFEKLRLEVFQMLSDREQKMLQSLQSYFEIEAEGLHLVEKYREDLLGNRTSLQGELASYLQV